MCNHIYLRYMDCDHSIFQNTFPCHIVQGCEPKQEAPLEKAVFLPQRPRIPGKPMVCKQKTLVRGETGICTPCEKARARGETTTRPLNMRSVSTGTPLGPVSALGWANKDQLLVPRDLGRSTPGPSPSPDPAAMQAVRNSFLRFSLMQQPTPEEEPQPRGMGDLEDWPLRGSSS
ncbi:hypothetical protein AB5N19_00820 [Seiridium cardinale]